MTSSVLLIAAGVLAAGVLMGWLLARAAGGAERARLRETFAALSADALRANNQQFLDHASP